MARSRRCCAGLAAARQKIPLHQFSEFFSSPALASGQNGADGDKRRKKLHGGPSRTLRIVSAGDLCSYHDALTHDGLFISTEVEVIGRARSQLAATDTEIATDLVNLYRVLGGGWRIADRPELRLAGVYLRRPELRRWYPYYFAIEHGREGYARYRRDLAEPIWELVSPKWEFDDPSRRVDWVGPEYRVPFPPSPNAVFAATGKRLRRNADRYHALKQP